MSEKIDKLKYDHQLLQSQVNSLDNRMVGIVGLE